VDHVKALGQKFVWDEEKALTNARKHGITFELAATVFRDPLRVTSHDFDHADFEDRSLVVGLTRSDILVVVICAVDEREDYDHVRIISARKATLRERREYESGEYAIREPAMTEEDNAKATPEVKVDDDYDDGMKAEYDFSKGIRGAFKHWRLPIHIDNEVLGYFHMREIKLGIDTTDAINEILRAHVGLPPRAVKPPGTPDDTERR
jgi:uncharacterized protein